MKQLKSIFIAVAFFMSAQFVTAQSKVAHIDMSELMTTMPAMKTAQAQLEKIQKSYDGEYNTMVQEYQTKMKKYQADAETGTVTDAVNETRAKEMQDMGTRIQQYRETATKELQQKELDLVKPIMEKATAAVQKVARAKGIEYVLDSTVGSGVMLADGPNLLADVKKELGF
jgi:outer membrane protein